MIPERILLFHFTALKNLPFILQAGGLKSKNSLKREAVRSVNIAYNHIQDRRARTLVPQTGLSLHDYVPFMFAPRSPMLYAIINGQVSEAEETNQNEIIYFVTDVADIADKVDFVFTDHQAVCSYASFYNELKDLDKIDWPLFFEEPKMGGYCKFFYNKTIEDRYCKRRESREAEFLIKEFMPLALIRGIAVRTKEAQNKVETLFKNSHINLNVSVCPAWYF